MRRGLLMFAIFGLVSMLVGCAQPMTPVDFHAPPGSTMLFDGKTFNLPAVVPLPRPGRPGAISRSDISFTFPGPGNQTINATGWLYMIGYNETDVARLADIPCKITDDKIGALTQGDALVLNGKTGDGQPSYRIVIGKAK